MLTSKTLIVQYKIVSVFDEFFNWRLFVITRYRNVGGPIITVNVNIKSLLFICLLVANPYSWDIYLSLIILCLFWKYRT